MQLIEKAMLPTPWGNFLIFGFEEKKNGKNHVALVYGDIKTNTPTLSRVHSECLTGDAFFSLRCDCGSQLEMSMKRISQEGSGVLIYHRQEGRNIGLLNKIKAYALQDRGLDTVQANQKLGFSADERDFSLCADIFNILNIKKIRLLTNNPFKVQMLSDAGINIVERVPLIVKKNPKNAYYLKTKAEKMGHLLSE
ncbi:GTP cyclohydrolase II [Buchnera aphidicola str. APS (Acyrthosiphon pisum)]|uniref:GTP cyclohydrolase-2 n=2 Tax=Buchnera aphidicola TaxID=9 RepID=RIBA_BUCAI|nr:GTP cyclohydrolase II [Buchnera aphidicola]P57359.1 RecName: Full=GTP cyclohydrolase-2; AltName: Full=GTP cyclohydrolase II [Buchnera aphidicola str. APS (Acyrthosiphon pisum)]pir/E84961/ GTP cyclohydrolase II (EC 3.5.4.25) [imported] - Buchnera sp. (strain APS) [Buchnera sp. (in: enterobacteria)]ADP66665.1 GTP cyclohydrolase II [Buchnera aphidicola str. TLW03 (Acyrthosiphon pisum)]ADP67775.1 GTP cyclohydrolase II [Buchnera aphidicola str. JF98 (Acyrthosiphon pisum)]OQX99762.1 MAG: GTP cycl